MSDELYERLGGREGIRAVVDDFYDALADDSQVGVFFEDVKLEKLRQVQTDFLCEAAGGPESYDDEPVREAHADVPLEPSDVRQAVAVLRETLESHGVTESDTEAVVEVIAAHKKDLVANP